MTAPRTSSPAEGFRAERYGVLVESPVPLDHADLAHALDEARRCGADRVTASIDPDGVLSFAYYRRRPPFERIRRITGYLVGTLDRFNDAKRAEEHDRVKHGLNEETK